MQRWKNTVDLDDIPVSLHYLGYERTPEQLVASRKFFEDVRKLTSDPIIQIEAEDLDLVYGYKKHISEDEFVQMIKLLSQTVLNGRSLYL